MVVPNSMPYIVAGLRLAIGRAVLGVVVAEFFGSEEGLGVMMVQAASRYQVDVVFAGLIVFAALSLADDRPGEDGRAPAEPLAAAARVRELIPSFTISARDAGPCPVTGIDLPMSCTTKNVNGRDKARP